MAVEAIGALRSSNAVQNFGLKRNVNVASAPLAESLIPFGVSAVLTFTGNPDKNKNQIVSIAAEYGQLLKGVYEAGGLGVVTNEAAQAIYKKNKDIRTICPYYSADNRNGKIKVRSPLGDKSGFRFKEVSLNYRLKPGEDFVSHEKPVPGKESQTAYRVIERTGIKGKIKSIGANLSGINELPYEVFKFKDTGKDKPAVYCIHLPSTSKFEKCYNLTPGTLEIAKDNRSFEDADYSDFDRAVADALPKLNNKKFGDFNPASIWLHDRQTFPFMVAIAEKSSKGDEYYRGIKSHLTHHNAGRDYQGHYRCALDFFRIVGNEEDLKALKSHPEYDFVQKMVNKIATSRRGGKRIAVKRILTVKELEKLDEIFAPLLKNFRDTTGEYNMTKISPNAVKLNPDNVSAGSVSRYYGTEMRNSNTIDCAKGLTEDFQEMPVSDVLNGSTPSNLKLGITGDFGKGNFNNVENKEGFTPLKLKYNSGQGHVLQNADEIYEAKLSNKKWMLDLIGAATKSGSKDLHDLFFEATDIKSNVLGGLSKYKEGDQLIIGWGRPDPQKGFATTLESYLQFFKDKDVDEDLKLKTKVLLSAGPWNTKKPDWQDIKRLMGEIAKLEGGKYANNVCYLNGYFTSRMVACADFAHITSRFEPCGITPFEAFAAGTPVISNKTGGSPDFITPYNGKNADVANGFLTEHPYFINPKDIGLPESLTGRALDNARRIKLGEENAACIKEAMTLATTKADVYKKMLKNAASLKTDWHNNHKLNNGISSVNDYLRNIWAVNSLKPNNNEPLKSLKGEICVA